MTLPRQHPRYSVKADVRIRIPEGTFTGRSQNVSRGGVCLDLRAPIPCGQEGLIDLSLPQSPGATETLTLNGRIVWCTAIGREYQIGIQWGPTSRELAGHLERFLRLLGHQG